MQASARLLSDGYEIVEYGPLADIAMRLRELVVPLLEKQPLRGGVRNASRNVPGLIEVIHGPMKALAEERLGAGARAVRVLLFDKTPTANWKVAWHQDVTIAVRDKLELPGWGPWSMKEGVWHVRPPVEVLADMLTLRLHLDPCGPDNGPVRVLPGTHCLGRLSDAEIERRTGTGDPVDCLVPEGGVLVMRPLILHSSAPAKRPGHRRVLHVEFANRPLPDGLEWAEQGVSPGLA